jgi:hypothetical protein
VIEPRAVRGTARYERVDFGARPGSVHTFTARLAARVPGARIEVWLEDERRLGTLQVASTGGIDRDQSVALDTGDVEGSHAVVLKIFGARKVDRVSTIELH